MRGRLLLPRGKLLPVRLHRRFDALLLLGGALSCVHGAGFGDCLTDCVKALGDEELDHTKLFSCSARCNINVPKNRGSSFEEGAVREAARGGRSTLESEDDEGGGDDAASAGHQIADPQAGRVGKEEEVEKGEGWGRGLGGQGEGAGSRVLTKGQVEAGRSADGKVRVILSDRETAKDGANQWEWVRLDLDGWTDAARGDAELGIPSGSVGAIYASHVLQSFHYRLEDEVRQTLRGWYDLLEPGGRLYLSVPDFPTLCWLYLNPTSNMNGRFRILQMMMGSQEGKHKAHHSGYDFQFLGYHLNEAGFSEYERVPEFHLFSDESSRKVSATYISLNVIAHKPSGAAEGAAEEL